MELDYKRRCRTCLASGVQMYKLNGPIINNTNDTVAAIIADEQKSTIIEYLRYCTHLPDVPELPTYICVNCYSALQVAYNFIRNALHAHDVLCHKLCPAMRQRCNGLNYRDSHEERKRNISINDSREDGRACGGTNAAASPATERAMRFRCKVCGEKVDSKKSLKEHVKLHLDIISYTCEMCAYQCKRRSELGEHYKSVHAVEASREQLKAHAELSSTPSAAAATTTTIATAASTETLKLPELDLTDDFLIKEDIFAQMEAIHNTPTAELDQQSHEMSASAIMQHDLDGGLTIISGDNVNCTNNLQNLPQDLTNEMTVGNEFIVMADGTVEEVMENGVVIQYINASDPSNNVSMDSADLLLSNAVNMDVDVDDIIIEENITSDAVYDDASTIEQIISQQTKTTTTATNTTAPLNSMKSINETGKQIKCKICADTFSTQSQLKTHMLTHNEIPHFFCDRCPFYTFFKVDLTQHYKMQHNLEPTYKQLLPKNKLKATTTTATTTTTAAASAMMSSNLSNSSSSGFGSGSGSGSASSGSSSSNLTQSELRSTTITTTTTATTTATTTTTGSRLGRPLGSGSGSVCATTGNCVATSTSTATATASGDGAFKKYVYSCDLCLYETGVKMNLRKHYMSKHKRNATDVQLRPSIAEEVEKGTKVVVDAIRNLRTNELICRKCNKIFNAMDKFREHYKNQHCADSGVGGGGGGTLPLDALPQIVEVDHSMDDSAMDIMFEDIYEDEDDTEDIEGLILTSDDDFEDALDDPKKNKRNAFCVHCNHIFCSQYQFENHMFVHRGLAPYRCEMCTNLYNTKRALIRHYRAVHKKLPTRDMIQAKGDKVVADNMPVEHLELEEQKSVTLMCAKCPFESTEYQNIQIHLKTSHGLIDENYILEKLPFECPRCIRSFEFKEHLLAHLERSHSVATIIQRRPQSSATSTNPRRMHVIETATAATTTTTAATTTIASSTSVTIPTNAIVTATTNFNTTAVSNYAVISSSSSRRNNSNNNNNGNGNGNNNNSSESIMSPAQRCGGDTGTADEHNLNDNGSTNDFIRTTATTTTTTSTIATLTTSSNSSNERSINMNLTQSDAVVEIATKIPKQSSDNIDHLVDTLKSSAFIVTLRQSANGTEQFLCNTCTFAVDTIRELDAHSQQHPSDETRDRFNFKCPICQRKYRTFALLRHHMKRHINRKYSCTECPKTFVSRSEYCTHQRAHDATMRFACNMCEKEFRYAHHLKRHKDAQHYGKRHVCPIDGCGRQFTTMEQLRIHTWSHSGNMPYRCTRCDTVFKRRGFLREHALKVHSIKLSETDIAEIYRENVGHTNPYDFTVTTMDGRMLRRSNTSASTSTK